MAEPGDPDYRYSINRHNTNGTQTDFAISFEGGYLSASDIKVRYQDAVGNTTSPSFTMPDAATVSVSPAPAAGGEIIISRNTPLDKPLVDFTDTAILNEAVLDINAKQAIFVAAETRDRFFEMEDRSELALGNAAIAITTATTALVTANTAVTSANAAVVTANNAAADAAFAVNLSEDTASQFDALVDTVNEIAGGDFTQFAKYNEAGNWVIAQNFPAGTMVADNAILTSASVLNAATLGGQLPSYYTNITARLGYTPAGLGANVFTSAQEAPGFNIAGLTNASWIRAGDNPVLSWDASDYDSYSRSGNYRVFVIGGVTRFTIDSLGAFTGTTSAYARLRGPDIVVNRGDGTGLIEFGTEGQGRYIHGTPGTIYFSGFGTGWLAGGRIWTTANQGSGSGMDSDLLRGNTPLQVATTGISEASTGSGHWRRDSDGWTVMNGAAYAPADGFADYGFPREFSVIVGFSVSKVVGTPGASTGNAVWGNFLNNSSFRVGSDDAAMTVRWTAYGYT